MAIINAEAAQQKKLGHRNMLSGIERTMKALEDVRPPERHPAAQLDGLTPEEVMALPLSKIGLGDWGYYLSYHFGANTVGELLDVGWAPLYARKGIGRATLWEFTDAIRAAGLDWPQLTMDNHRHPARPKS